MNWNEVIAKTALRDVLVFLWKCTFWLGADGQNLRNSMKYSICISVLAAMMGMLVPFLLQNAILVFSMFSNWWAIASAVLVYSMSYATYQLMIYTSEMIFVPLSRKLAMELINYAFIHVANLGTNARVDSYALTRMMSRMVESIARVMNATCVYFVTIICEIASVVLLATLRYGYYLGGFIALYAVLFVMFTLIYIRLVLLPAYMRLISADGETYSFLADRINRLHVVGGSEIIRSQNYKLRSLLCSSEVYGTKYDVKILMLLLIQRLAMCLFVTLAIMICGYFLKFRSLHFSEVILIYGYVMHITKSVFSIGTAIRDIMPSIVTLTFMRILLQTKNQDQSVEPSIVNNRHGVIIRLYDICYKSDAVSLNKINISIIDDSVVCIVGGPGSGKSLVANLIARFRSPNSGRIYLDGRLFDKSNGEFSIGMVQSEDSLFYDTVLHNITLDDSRFVLSDAIELAEIFDLHDKIMMTPQNYKTRISRDSSPFSEYEIFVICLIRTLIRKPRVLIIDKEVLVFELASIIKSIRRYIPNITIIIFTRQAAMGVVSNQIFVLENGSVTQSGSYEQLASVDGEFRRILRKSSEI